MPSSRIPGSIPAPGKKVFSKKKNGLRFLVIIVALFLAFAIGFYGHIYYEAHPGMALPAAFESLLSGKAEVVPVSDSGVLSNEHI